MISYWLILTMATSYSTSAVVMPRPYTLEACNRAGEEWMKEVKKKGLSNYGTYVCLLTT